MLTEDPDDAYLRTLTVLLAEDDPSALDEFAIFLRRRVGRLVTAADGAQGLAAFAAERPQIVVTDIQMPVMDGLAMAQELRSLAPALPIIVITAFEQTGYMVRSIELGIDRYVLKPVKAGQLEAALRVCARRLRAEHELQLQAQREDEARRARLEAVQGMLLAGLAHDYNNLVQAILSAVAMARLTAGRDSAALAHLDLADRCSQEARLLSMRLSSLSAAPGPLSDTGPLEPLVRAAVHAALAGSAVTPQFDFQDGGSLVRHDPASLAQALRQVAGNAREAMGGAGVFQVATQVCLPGPDEGLKVQPGPCLRITCRDTGPGIPPADLPWVFEPYFTTKQRSSARGTGLGLALAEAILRAHGGAIQATNPAGGGAAILMHLPIYSSPTEGSASREGQG